ncbi:MAG: ATP-binding cassette domain-containing protein [Anaerolineae bacterium]
MRKSALNRHSILLALVILLTLAFPAVGGAYRVNQLGKFMVFAILALSLDLVWGYTGILSLGQAAFFGLGAYIAGLALKKLPLIWLYPALTGAILLPGLAALGLGRLMFYRKIGGAYFAIITLAVSLVSMQTALVWYDVTGGTNGIAGIPSLVLALPDLSPHRLGSHEMFYLLAAALLGTFYLSRWIVTSPFGKLLMAIRDNEDRTEFFGYDTARYKTLVFAIAGGIAGLAGMLYAPQVGFVSPLLLGFVLSTEIVIWAAVGGRGTLLGAILGAIGTNFVASYLSELVLYYWLGIIGLIFVLVVMFFPDGLFPLLARALDRLWPAQVARPEAVFTWRPATQGVGTQQRVPGEAGNAPILELQGLIKSLGGLLAVNNVDLVLGAQELRCLIGTNGAGKTTLFNLITGWLRPDAGRVRFRGEDITRLKVWEIAARGIGRKFQIPNVYDSLSVADNLAIAARSRNNSLVGLLFRPHPVQLDALTQSILERTGLLERMHVPAAELSHGEKQRLEISMVLASRPHLLLLDEPTAGLTVEETRESARLIRTIFEQWAMPMIIIEHDMGFLREIASPVTVMHRGQVLAEGSMSDIVSNPDVQMVYLGRV